MGPVVAAPSVSGLSPRPAAISSANPGAYAAKVSEFATALAANARGAPCPQAAVASIEGSALSDADLAREKLTRPGGSGAVWREHLEVTGCGAPIRVRLYMARTGEAAWGVLPLTPGDGRTGYLLGRDAGASAVAAAVMEAPRLACGTAEIQRTARLTDTALVTPYVDRSAWTERWTWAICGQKRPVLVTFTPDATGGGTSFAIKAR